MELNDAIALLALYNRWRRGEDENLDMPNPREIGVALDTVLAAVIEGGTGNSGAERPEPSPHFLQKGDTPETDALAHSGLCPVSYIAQMTDFARKLERERDEAMELHRKSLREREATEKEVDAMLVRALKAERERDEAMKDAKRATYDAAQETIKVSTLKSHWIEACRERDEAREERDRYKRMWDESRMETVEAAK